MLLFCDMDGVLVDFMEGAQRYSNGLINWNNLQTLTRKETWDLLGEFGEHFWKDLKWMSEGKELWENIKKYDPYILSAFPGNNTNTAKHREYALQGKIEWVAENLGNHFVNKTIVCGGNEKQLFARGNILIDDYEKNIQRWKKCGGIGILHTSTDKTLKKVYKLLK